MILMVGAEGFEPPTLCSQSRCATRLRYAPTEPRWSDCIAGSGWNCHVAIPASSSSMGWRVLISEFRGCAVSDRGSSRPTAIR